MEKHHLDAHSAKIHKKVKKHLDQHREEPKNSFRGVKTSKDKQGLDPLNLDIPKGSYYIQNKSDIKPSIQRSRKNVATDIVGEAIHVFRFNEYCYKMNENISQTFTGIALYYYNDNSPSTYDAQLNVKYFVSSSIEDLKIKLKKHAATIPDYIMHNHIALIIIPEYTEVDLARFNNLVDSDNENDVIDYVHSEINRLKAIPGAIDITREVF